MKTKSRKPSKKTLKPDAQKKQKALNTKAELSECVAYFKDAPISYISYNVKTQTCKACKQNDLKDTKYQHGTSQKTQVSDYTYDADFTTYEVKHDWRAKCDERGAISVNFEKKCHYHTANSGFLGISWENHYRNCDYVRKQQGVKKNCEEEFSKEKLERKKQHERDMHDY